MMFQRGVETFLAVARLKTLKAAAVKLHLAQSTVSKRLQQLEQECGIILFDRGKGGKEALLTPAGESFVSIAEKMLDLLYEARRFRPEQNRYALSIGAVTSMNAVFMPHLYERLLESEPALQLGIVTLHSAEMYDEIDTRHIDIGFSLLERTHPSVTTKQCFSEPMLGIRLGDGKTPHGAVVKLEDLNPQQEIYSPWTPKYQIWHYEWCPAGAARIQVDDPHLLFSLLRHPEQWAIVPLSVARFFQGRGAYTIFKPYPEPPDRVCYQLTHKYPRSRSAESLAVFSKHLRPVLKEEFGKNLDGHSLIFMPQ